MARTPGRGRGQAPRQKQGRAAHREQGASAAQWDTRRGRAPDRSRVSTAAGRAAESAPAATRSVAMSPIGRAARFPGARRRDRLDLVVCERRTRQPVSASAIVSSCPAPAAALFRGRGAPSCSHPPHTIPGRINSARPAPSRGGSARTERPRWARRRCVPLSERSLPLVWSAASTRQNARCSFDAHHHYSVIVNRPNVERRFGTTRRRTRPHSW